jgi:hypothetical protein
MIPSGFAFVAQINGDTVTNHTSKSSLVMVAELLQGMRGHVELS